MTRERAKELLPVIQAYAEGKNVQVSVDGHTWNDVSSADARFELNVPSQYRIKPEPRVFLAALYDQTGLSCVGGLFDTKEAAKRSGNNPDKLIKVREVLE